MSAAAPVKPEDIIVSEMKKASHDIEAQAVTKIVEDAEMRAQSELCQAIDDHLDDELLPPFDIIVKVLKDMVPKGLVAVKTRLDRFLSSVPFSGFLHLVLIEMMAVYIFYYSVHNVFTQGIEALVKHMERNKVWPQAAKVDKCLGEYSSRALWMRGHMNSTNCFDAAKVDGPYQEDDNPVMTMFGLINYGCLLLCCLLWAVVIGNFVWRNSYRISVPYHSGNYLKCALFTRRSPVYRYICGMIGLGAGMAILGTMFACAQSDMLGWFLQNQLGNLVVVVVSARAFLTPTKPKFEYDNLEQLSFKRPSFFQTNGAFAASLSNALIQSVRGEQFRMALVNVLEKPEDWELALKLCMVNQSKTTNSGNKVLLALWGAGQAPLPTILSTTKEVASRQ